MKSRPNHGLLAVLAVALLLRVTYWSKGLLGGDSIGYAIGGLGTWCAHSPGFFGFCFSGWLVNQVVGNINHSLILINVITSLLGIVFCHRLAESFGLSARNVLLATAAYAFSINLDYFSVVAASYPPEGMFATLVALLCRRAITRQSLKYMLWATAVWAVSGAFRQTSISFLAPLWLYSVWASGPLKRAPLYLLVAVPLVLAWSIPNKHYQAAYAGDLKADTGRGFWALQVMMPSDHDQTKLGLDEDVKGEAVSAYHWPFIEVLTWVDETLGLQVLPDYRSFGAPPPSLARAAKLSALQLGKLGFYLLFSLPCLLMLPALLPRFRKIKTLFRAGEISFFIAWMLPVGGFFIVGHCGSFGYLQIFLSGFSVLVVMLLSRCFAGDGNTRWMMWQKVHAGFTLAALAFFTLARPYQSADPREKLTDVLVLSYTGHAIQARYFMARSMTNAPGPGKDEPWLWCRSDADIMQWFATTKAAKICIYKPHVVR